MARLAFAPPRKCRGHTGGERGTCSCDGAGGEDREQALSLQVEEMLLLHLKKLLLNGDLLGRQLQGQRPQREKNATA